MIGAAKGGTRDEKLPELHIPGSPPVWNPIVKVKINIRYRVRYGTVDEL